jgi:hypothetical protein
MKAIFKKMKAAMPMEKEDPMLSLGPDEGMDEEPTSAPASPLEGVSDEDLLAEVKKRGLSVDGPAEEQQEM